MKTIANLFSLFEARNLRTLMISEGIEAFLPDEGKAASPSNPFSTRAGFRLQVREEDEDRAVEIINQAYAIAG